MIKLPKLILASASPRRSEILSFVGWEFEKHSADIDESVLENEKPAEYVQRLAAAKALAVAGKFFDKPVLGADTIVVIDEKIIGKPKDLAEAKEMLKLLAGRWHEVLTGVAIVTQDVKKNIETVVAVQKTRVKFAELSEQEIEFLVMKGSPLDKAGAYAVQAQAALFIEKIEGDYWNVVGLPVNLIYKLMKQQTKTG